MTDTNNILGKEQFVRSVQEQSEDWQKAIPGVRDNYIRILQKQAQSDRQEIKALKEENERLKGLVDRDSLTGLYSKRYLQKTIPKRIEREKRRRRAWGIFMIDIDFFKSVNDTYGHPMGDTALQHVSKMLQCVSRASDAVIRYGGDEICIVVFDINTAQELVEFAERCRKAVFATSIDYDGQNISVTVTIGACFVPGDSSMSLLQVMSYADKALLEAKESGRNRVVVSDRRKTIRIND